MKSFRALAFALVCVAAFNNCEPASELPQSSDPLDNPYGIGWGTPLEQKALQILKTHCANCHSGGMRNGGIVDILDVGRLIAHGFVLPGNPMSSPLFISVQENRMPKNAQPLPLVDRDTLRAWIAGEGLPSSE